MRNEKEAAAQAQDKPSRSAHPGPVRFATIETDQQHH